MSPTRLGKATSMGARSKTSSSGKTDSWDHSSDSDGKSSISSSSYSSSGKSNGEDNVDLEAPVEDFARAINDSVAD